MQGRRDPDELLASTIHCLRENDIGEELLDAALTVEQNKVLRG